MRRAVHKFGTVRALANALGFDDPSRISRGKPFNVYYSLRLAEVAGEHPSEVLRASNKGDLANLIERLYGSAKIPISPEQQTLIAWFDQIQNPEARASLVIFARLLVSAQAPGAKGGPGSEESGPIMPPPKGSGFKMTSFFPTRRMRAR